MFSNPRAHFLGKFLKRQAYIRASSILPCHRPFKPSCWTPSREIHRLSYSLGIESPHGLFIPLIRSGSPIPVETSETFTSTSGLAAKEEIRILQGNNELARNNAKLGSLDLAFAQPQQPTEISLTFSLKASTLHVSAYNIASPLLTQTISLHIIPYFEKNRICDEDEEVCFIKAKEHAENTLQILRTSLENKNETLNEVPFISSCVDELEAILQTNDFGAASAINDCTLALRKATMHHFERTHHRRHRSCSGESIFADLDSPLSPF
jgi:molecular chaperone DnaK